MSIEMDERLAAPVVAGNRDAVQLTFTLNYPPDQPFGVFFAPRGTSVHFTSWRMPLDGSVEAHDFHTHGGKGILVETWRSLPPQLTHWVLRACDSQRGPTPIQWSWPRWELGRWIRCDHWELSWHPFVRCRPAYTQHYASDDAQHGSACCAPSRPTRKMA